MDWSRVLETALRIAIVLALAGIALVVAQIVSQRVLRRFQAVSEAESTRRRQLQTIIQVSHWTVRTLIITIALMMVLSNFVDIAPLLTSVGIVGLAISLGAQSLIRDLIAGILILAEGQYAVGDTIQVGDKSGTVERITLRVTHIRSLDGNLHMIPNGEVRIVSNITKDWSRAVVDINIPYKEDLERVLAVLSNTAQTLAQDPEFGPLILEPPEVMAPVSLGDLAMTAQVTTKTLPDKRSAVAIELRKRILAACEREGIVLPYPR